MSLRGLALRKKKQREEEMTKSVQDTPSSGDANVPFIGGEGGEGLDGMQVDSRSKSPINSDPHHLSSYSPRICEEDGEMERLEIQHRRRQRLPYRWPLLQGIDYRPWPQQYHHLVQLRLYLEDLLLAERILLFRIIAGPPFSAASSKVFYYFVSLPPTTTNFNPLLCCSRSWCSISHSSTSIKTINVIK